VIVDAANPCADTPLLVFPLYCCNPGLIFSSVDLGDFTKTVTSWTVNLAAGTVVQINVEDSEEGEAWSRNVRISFMLGHF